MYTLLVVPAIVVIGPTEALGALRAQLPENRPLQTFTDHQVREAVEFIATHRPAIVGIEETFAVSPRGEALVGRIMDDPSLASCEIRILAYSQKAERDKSRRKSGAGIPVAAPPVSGDGDGTSVRSVDRRGTRRTERIRMLAGVVITVDGNPAELVDLSAAGAQVVSRVVLRPNQRVRLQLPEPRTEGKRMVRCAASVVWASFEMPAGQPPRYRAGLKLASPTEAEALQHFALLHQAPEAESET